MVSRADYNFVIDYFEEVYILHTKPSPKNTTYETNPDNVYSNQDEVKFRTHVRTMIGLIYGYTTGSFPNIEFGPEKDIVCNLNFGMSCQEAMEKFTESYRQNFKHGTGGPVLLRIASYCIILEDSAECLLELADNECTPSPLNTFRGDEDFFNIRSQCTLLFFSYDEESKKRIQMKINDSPYKNIKDNYMIIDGVEFAAYLKIDVNWLKNLISESFINNTSTIIYKIRNDPRLIINMSDKIKLWLFSNRRVNVLKRSNALPILF